MTANSAPTKKALKASSTTSHAMPAQSLIALTRLGALGHRHGGEAHAIDAPAVHALHGQGPVLDAHLVAGCGHALEHAHDVSADGVVDVALRHADTRPIEQLVGTQLAGEREGVRSAD